MALERDDAPAVRLAGSDTYLKVAEERLRDCRPTVSGRHADLDMHSRRMTIGERRRKEHRERHVILSGQPQPVLQATHGHRVTDIDIIVLQRTDSDDTVRTWDE